MKRRHIPVLLLLACLCMAQVGLPPLAPKFHATAVYGFGDSTIDSGWFKTAISPGVYTGDVAYDALLATALPHQAGKPTTNPGLMSIEVLAAYFGLAARPANQSGTDYAVSGARSRLANGDDPKLFPNAIPTATQIVNFLKLHLHADPHAIYVVSAGNNDVAHAIDVPSDPHCPALPVDCVRTAARDLAAAIVRLHAAGAAIIIVPNLFESYGTPPKPIYRKAFDVTLRAALAAAHVEVIAADMNGLRTAIVNGHGAFGIHLTATGTSSPACTQPASVASAWAMLCSPASPVSSISPPGAAAKFLFADDGHFTTAGQRIAGDYFYCLLVKRFANNATIGSPPWTLEFPALPPPRPDCAHPSNLLHL